jgi:hypothetical protein
LLDAGRMLDLARWLIDTQHHHRDPPLSESVGDQFPAVVKRITIQEQLDGNAFDWIEKVSDEEYLSLRKPWKQEGNLESFPGFLISLDISVVREQIQT